MVSYSFIGLYFKAAGISCTPVTLSSARIALSIDRLDYGFGGALQLGFAVEDGGDLGVLDEFEDSAGRPSDISISVGTGQNVKVGGDESGVPVGFENKAGTGALPTRSFDLDKCGGTFHGGNNFRRALRISTRRQGQHPRSQNERTIHGIPLVD